MRRAIWLVAMLACGVAWATKPALRLERVDPSAFASDGKLRVFASLVELEGQVDDGRVAESFTLRVDGKHPVKAEKVEAFRAAAVPLDLVLVIESSALYGVQQLVAPTPSAPAPPTKRRGKHERQPAKAPAAPNIPIAPVPLASGELPIDRVKEALAALLEGRPAKTRVLVIDYGGDVTPHPPFRPAQAAGGALDELQPDDESGDLRLVDAVRAALIELNRPRADDDAPPRRLIVVVSDGLNAQMDRKTFRALGDAAATAGVPIHSLAFSPADDRGPLLNLGEISKRSNGTFRWAKNADELKTQIETLADELDKQYVLTFAPALDRLEGHTFELRCDELRSNPLRYETGGSVFGYTGPTERRSVLWLGLEIVGGIAVALLLCAVIVTLVGRARRPRARAIALPSARFAAGPRGPRLVFLDGERAGTELALDPRNTFLFGKERSAIALADPAMSTRHAELRFDGRGWLVTDLGSTNGTWVDGQRIIAPTYLAPGAVLQIGQTRVRLIVA